MLSRRTFARSLAAASAAAFAYAAPRQRGVLLISVDGLRPDYVTRADELGLKIPNLRVLMKTGVHATRVRGVLPTVTYSSHVSLVTGVAPARHGIPTNRPFDPERKPTGIWHWYAREIRVPTLWQAAAEAGYVTGSISWPVTVGADAIRYNIPEYARTRDEDDIKMIRGLATPGLMAELESKLGPYSNDVNEAIPRDWLRTKWAAEMIRTRRIRFMTVHLASTDHIQHESGPFTPAAIAAVEEVDKMIGAMRDAMLSIDPEAAVCIVSDHGFARVDHQFKLDLAFVKAGLITLKSRQNTIQASGVGSWTAMPWESGGSAAVVLKDRKDQGARAQVAKFLAELAANQENGIGAILDGPAIAKMGGHPSADFWISMRPGYSFSASLSEPLVATVSTRGTHGYAPDQPDLASFFLISARGIRKGVSVGEIDMRSIAPTVARFMGAKLDTAEGPLLPIE